MLQIGTPAPAFELPDASMEMVRLSKYRGKKKCRAVFLSERRHASVYAGGD